MPFRIALVSLAFLAGACVLGGCGHHRSARAPAANAPAVAGADLGHGAVLYQAQCAACHGERGRSGPLGPSLRDENLRRPYDAVQAIVLDPEPPMPKLFPGRLTQADVRDVSAYVETL